MEVRWLPEAKLEADAAASYYKERQPGLEIRFLDVLEDVLRRIQRHPQIYRKVNGNLRKCKLPRFPFGVIFRVRTRYIEIIAVMHLRKAPGYWKHRF